MRSVNANLFEINQAKSRIKAAKEAGQTPDPADEALVATEVQNAYAIAQYADVMTIEKFARHISTHGCVYSRADISAILYMAVDCMREQLLMGNKVCLGDMGSFFVTINCKGADSLEDFNSGVNIKKVNVNWERGRNFKNLIEDASQGKLDPVIGRDDEIRRVLQILSRRTKTILYSLANPVRVRLLS